MLAIVPKNVETCTVFPCNQVRPVGVTKVGAAYQAHIVGKDARLMIPPVVA